MQNAVQDVQLNKNVNSYLIWSNYYSTVIQSFKWKNLPYLKIQPFLIEEYLAYWGICGAFKDKDEIKILPCFGNGRLLENGLYSSYTFISKNSDTYTRNLEDIELCFNNSNRIPSILSINEFTQKTSYALQVVDSALRKANLPAIIVADDETDLSSIGDLYDEQGNMKPFRVTLNQGFSNGDIKRTDLFDNKNVDVEALFSVFKQYNDLFFNSFGVSTSIAKSERMSREEALSNDEMIRCGLISDMEERRKEFAERCNSHFGTRIDVNLNRSKFTDEQIEIEEEDVAALVDVDNEGVEDND